MVDALEEDVDVEALVFGVQAETVGDFREGRVAHVDVVVRVDAAVTVDILVLDVTHAVLAEGLHRGVRNLLLALEQADGLEAPGLGGTDAVRLADTVLVLVLPVRFVVVDEVVAVVGEIAAGGEEPVADLLVELGRHIDTAVAGLTDVHVRELRAVLVAGDAGQTAAEHEDAGTV